MCNHHNNRHGSALEHGEAHTKDHQRWSRRNFIRNLGMIGGGSMLLGNSAVSALGASPLSMALNGAEGDRVLVLIRLKGGNDGLNTIIPLFDYDTYANLRPNIRIPENDLITLTDEFAIPSSLQALEPLWNEGAMRVVNSVGYPDQNLSHFRSTDIWSSGSDADVVDSSGWLGRYLTDLYPTYLTNPPAVPPAIQIGGFGSLTFNDLDRNSLAVSVSDPRQLEEIAENGQLYDLNNLPECLYGDQLGYLRSVANSTFQYAEVISDAADAGRNAVEYPRHGLANSLATVARLIKGNLGTKLYMVTLDGFDTHARQDTTHPQLMMQLAGAIQSFYTDLAAAGWADKVLAMTFSEFGRRVQQNASRGTDHGAAAPLMLFGGEINGSTIQGQRPNLSDLDGAGNLKFDTDFRQVYATILENWLCVDSSTVNQVMGQNFQRLNLGFQCGVTTSTFQAELASIQHYVAQNSRDAYTIHYQLPNTASVRIQVFSVMGQEVALLKNTRQHSGKYEVSFIPSQYRLPSGQYFYRITADEAVLSGGMQVVR